MSPIPIPITILTGFLGSGKTTLILNLLPQLPPTYRLALLKNEFGEVAIDSQIASSRSIAGVQELLNGCICCSLVGQLGDALDTLRKDVQPDRIVIETSGSAFPATLAMEVNRLARETGGKYMLDGVVVVIDVENWKGYEDTSYTAKLQARYTDLVVLNKWEDAGDERLEACLDRLGDLEVDVAFVKSDRGKVPQEALLGVDRRLGGTERLITMDPAESKHAQDGDDHHHHHHDQGQHVEDHSSEVEVLSISLMPSRASSEGGERSAVLDIEKLEQLLQMAPKDEVYRIKAIFNADHLPTSSDGTVTGKGNTKSAEINGFKEEEEDHTQPVSCILNWAFGRWTFFEMASTSPVENGTTAGDTNSGQQPNGNDANGARDHPVLRMTVVLARGEAEKWKKRIQQKKWMCLKSKDKEEEGVLTVEIKR